MRSSLITGFINIINNQSIKRRVLISLFSNIVRSGLNFISVLLLARSLSSSGYGDLMFLIGSFVAIRSLMDLGAANAFFTFISQGEKRSIHYILYFSWLIIQFVLLGLFIQILCPASLFEIIWLGHSRYLVLLAFIASFLQQQGWQTINQIGESERKTVWNQIFGVSIAVTNLLGIILLGFFGTLNIINILIFYIIEYSIILIIAFFTLGTNKYLFCPNLGEMKIRSVVPEYIKYCYPLVMITVIGFLYNYIDTWILQYFGGSTQQGLFQIANQVAMISLLATSSVLNIFWKEIAAAYEQNDKEKVQRIYFKAMRGMVMFGAVISGFLVPWTNQIIQLLLGEAYSNAAPILVIMFFYPIHQSMGQLTGAFFFATKQTRIYSIASIIIMLISMPVTYFFQAPSSGYLFPGLGLGALGLALKTVIINIVGVNISVYIISRLQGWNYNYSHQLYAIALTSMVGYISYWGAHLIGSSSYNCSIKMTLLLQGLIGAIIYFPSILLLIYYIPGLAGVSRLEVQTITQRIKGMLFKEKYNNK